MQIIIGGDTPLTKEERHLKEVGVTIDLYAVNLPKWNPRMIEIARHLEGIARYEFAKRAKISTKRYTEIENGNVTPTDEEMQNIAKTSTHVLITFFEQWPLTEPDFRQVVPRPIPIDYYKYKVFRDINKPQSMKAV